MKKPFVPEHWIDYMLSNATLSYNEGYTDDMPKDMVEYIVEKYPEKAKKSCLPQLTENIRNKS